MDTHSESLSCLSAQPHDTNVKDPVLHYFGCLEAWERDAFLQGTSSYWLRKVEKLQGLGTCRSEAEAKVEAERETCERRCAEELRRVSRILHTFSHTDKQSYLLTDLAKSRETWRASKEYKLGIGRVREWRTGKFLPNGDALASVEVTKGELYNPDSNIKVQVIAFKEGVPCNLDSKYVTGTFPNQATSVYELLRRDTPGLFNLLKQKRDNLSATGPVWIHIPSNNMLVSLQVTLYYIR